MIYGELGKHPISVDIKMRMLSYTKNLTEGSANKYSEMLFKVMENDTVNANNYKWIKGIKIILDEAGFSF